MALHEIVLRFPDRDEVRLGDGPGYERNEEVVVDNRTFVVVGTEPPQAPTTSRRFILELVESPGVVGGARPRRRVGAPSGVSA